MLIIVITVRLMEANEVNNKLAERIITMGSHRGRNDEIKNLNY